MNLHLIVRNLFFIILISVFYPGSYVSACTAFMMSDGDKVFVGNNEDYNIPHTRVWFIPSENGQFGRVYFGYENWSPQGGVNDQGLFFDFFATKPLEVQQSKDKPKFKGPIIDTMVATCATVEDVIEMFSQYNLEFMSKFQMFVVDKTGDAAVIEGDEIVRKSGQYQIVTNFYQSKVPENKRPCEWYRRSCQKYKIAESMINEIDTPTIDCFRDILDATHRETTFATTLYSNIYDLKEGVVHLYYLHDFENEVMFDLKEELKKGRHYYILPNLFGKDQKYDHKTFKNKSPDFSVSYPKHFKVNEPKENEVLRVRCPHSSNPLFMVIVDDKPSDIDLDDIWEKHLSKEVQEFASNVKLIYSKQAELQDGTSAREIRFDWFSNGHWLLKTIILATYNQDHLVMTAWTAFAHPEIFNEFLYSIKFY